MKFPSSSQLSPAELAGQLLMPAWNVQFMNKKSPAQRKLVRFLEQYHIGGLILFGGHPGEVQETIRLVQTSAKLPLLIGADLERGLGSIFQQGTIFPHALAWGAADNLSLVKDAAEIIAREARATGINTLFAPVLDLVCEPENPIINIRGFHHQPSQVADFARAFIPVIQSSGIICVAKHFPGHGTTKQDSHIDLPRVNRETGFLQKNDMLPFHVAAEIGVKGIMSAHILMQGETLPATLNPKILGNILRQRLKFSGVTFSDALDMKAISDRFSPAEQIILGLTAGLNVFLMPENLPLFHHVLTELIENNEEIARQAIQSYDRIIQLKKWIHQKNPVLSSPGQLYKFINHPNHHGKAMEIAEKSMVCIHRSRKFPLRIESIQKCHHMIFTDFPADTPVLENLNSRLAGFFDEVELHINAKPAGTNRMKISSRDMIVLSIYSRTFGGHISRFDWELIHKNFTILLQKKVPLVVMIFGNPFIISHLKDIYKSDAVFLTFSYVETSQIAAFKSLISFIEIRGTLPVSLQSGRKKIAALKIPRRTLHLDSQPENQVRLPELDKFIQQSITQKFFPGGVLLLAHQEKIIYLKGFGYFDYSSASPKVHSDTCYDLASLTKVVATTPALLTLAHKNRIRLEESVRSFYPVSPSRSPRRIALTDLLAHQAGFADWLPFYKEYSSKVDIIQQILNAKPIYPVGKKSVYSDLGFMLLGDIIERVSGTRLDQFCRDQIFHPLGLDSLRFIPTSTGSFLPNPAREKRYPPTGFEEYRRRILQGEVNDTNCYAMGGIAGHAGLFGNAQDVAAIGQLFLNNGIYNCQQIFRASMAQRAIQRINPTRSDRALGWDTAVPSGSTGQFFSKNSFGHLAYTGPSIWVDPERRLLVVFLCNRTHPDPGVNKLNLFRPALHDLIIRTLHQRKILNKF